MDLRLLTSFVAVAEDLNFSRAAERLRIAQPALSRQIAQLEGELGGKLFERTKRRVNLTEAGDRFLEEARLALAQVERAVAVGRNAVSGQIGLLRVATTSATMFNPLTADLLLTYQTRWPGVEIDLQEMTAAQQNAAFGEGRIELGLLHVDADVFRAAQGHPWTKVHLHVLCKESLVAVVSTSHPLAGRSAVRLAELTDEVFLTLPRHHTPEYGGPFHRLARLRGAPVRQTQRVLNVSAMVHLAGAGLGIALVPECMTSIRAQRVRYIRISDETDTRLFCLAYPRNVERPALANFIALALAHDARPKEKARLARR
jgi:DNA-binding transcriptional LysR family regulator